MRFNPLIPELTVADIARTKDFYVRVLQFRIEYERPEDRFAFLSLEGTQLMVEQDNGHWSVGPLEYPYGRGVNFEMTVFDVERLYERVLALGAKPFRALETHRYQSGGETIAQREFLIQDPDGYLLRFTD